MVARAKEVVRLRSGSPGSVRGLPFRTLLVDARRLTIPLSSYLLPPILAQEVEVARSRGGRPQLAWAHLEPPGPFWEAHVALSPHLFSLRWWCRCLMIGNLVTGLSGTKIGGDRRKLNSMVNAR